MKLNPIMTAAALILLALVFRYDLSRYTLSAEFVRGTEYYRSGDYDSAGKMFGSVAADTGLFRYQSLYNQGNCMARLAEQPSVKAEDAVALYSRAVDLYGRALVLKPDDESIRHNLMLVNAALATLKASDRKHETPGKGSGLTGGKTGEQTPNAKQSLKTAGKGGASTERGEDGVTVRREKMSAEQVERFLRGNRGGDMLPSASMAAQGLKRIAPVNRDW